jgi:hypothetical protein
MKVEVTRDDGTVVDVTEAVQIAYDVVRGSLDWSSGFLDTEEVDAIVHLSQACSFPDFEDLFREVQADRRRQEEVQAKQWAEKARAREQAALAEERRQEGKTAQAGRLAKLLDGFNFSTLPTGMVIVEGPQLSQGDGTIPS